MQHMLGNLTYMFDYRVGHLLLLKSSTVSASKVKVLSEIDVTLSLIFLSVLRPFEASCRYNRVCPCWMLDLSNQSKQRDCSQNCLF